MAGKESEISNARGKVKIAMDMVDSDMEKISCLLTISGSKSNMSGHQAALSNVKFLDKGHTIMSTSVDGEVRFWDLSLLLRLKLTQIGLERHEGDTKSKKNDSSIVGGLRYGMTLLKFFRKRLTYLFLKIGGLAKKNKEQKSNGKSSRRDKITRTDHRSILMTERYAILSFIWIVLESRTPWPSSKRALERDGRDGGKYLDKCEVHKVHDDE